MHEGWFALRHNRIFSVGGDVGWIDECACIGADAQARFASALYAHRVGSLPDDAIYEAQGASGTTPVSLELEPGACYLAIVVEKLGPERGIGLRVTVGERVSDDERGAKDSSAIVAFCAADAARAEVEVDARSSGAGWALAVFRNVGGVWGLRP